MHSAYKWNKQDDNIQPWHTPFLIWNQSVVLCPVLTVASWPAYKFLRRQVRWSGIPISFRIFHFIVIHTVKGFGIVNKAKIDVFLEVLLFQWSSGYWQLDLWSCLVWCMLCCIQCHWPCSRPPPTHASTGNSWTLPDKSRSVSCGATAPFSWVLVHTRFYLCPPRVCFPSPV